MQNIRLNNKSLLYLLVIVLAYYVGEKDLLNSSLKKLNIPIENIVNESQTYTVSQVVDGDTIHVRDNNNSEDIVRLLAVNTLEKNATSTRERCLADLETKFTKENLLGKQVFLVHDQTQPKRDVYNRLLAYVATNSATTSYYYNDLLMQTGNAKVYKANPPAEMYQKYVAYQAKAQAEKLGMWNPQLCK